MGFLSCTALRLNRVARFFFISKISYKYNFLSSECLTINEAWNTLYLSISPYSSYTGNANRESYRYQPYFAFLQCFSSLFSRKYLPLAISISSGLPCAAFAFALPKKHFHNPCHRHYPATRNLPMTAPHIQKILLSYNLSVFILRNLHFILLKPIFSFSMSCYWCDYLSINQQFY